MELDGIPVLHQGGIAQAVPETLAFPGLLMDSNLRTSQHTDSVGQEGPVEEAAGPGAAAAAVLEAFDFAVSSYHQR
jgi:hypothetical protein